METILPPCLPHRTVGRRRIPRAVGVDFSAEGLLRAALRREAPFAGLYALASMARARWALDFALARLAAGGPLSTRLEFVRPPEAA